jgi:hypothetical protein
VAGEEEEEEEEAEAAVEAAGEECNDIELNL